VAVKLRPNAERAFVSADPGTQVDALSRKEALLELTIVGDIVIGAPEAAGDLAELWCIHYVFVDDVMNRGGAGIDLAGRTNVSIALVIPPPRTMSTLAISMISLVAGSMPVVSMSMTRIKGRVSEGSSNEAAGKPRRHLARHRLEMDAKLFRANLQQCDLVVQPLHGYLSVVAAIEALVTLGPPSANTPTSPMAPKIAAR
jgi:hypothetical protein